MRVSDSVLGGQCPPYMLIVEVVFLTKPCTVRQSIVSVRWPSKAVEVRGRPWKANLQDQTTPSVRCSSGVMRRRPDDDYHVHLKRVF